MKRIFIALCAICPLFAHADIIATFNNGNIEDVTVVSIGADEVVYKKGNTQKSVASSEVEGVLYDDGRFVAPPKKAATESIENTSNDSWAVDDASTDDSQIASSNRRQKREKKERNSNSEVGQAFKEAGVAIKDAFSTMFDAMGKKKDKSSSESTTNTSTDTESNQDTPASEDGW